MLELRIEDKSYADIARSLDISEKSVDNALARIRKKLRSRQ
ncbi:MAG: sigma factor-like helix-turn-helix DNA-binding protein [Oscillospiraceae bacterium]